MPSSASSLTFLALTLLFGCGGSSDRSGPERYAGAEMLDLGRQFTESFLGGDLGTLWSRMTIDMRDAAGGSVAEFRTFREKVADLAGEEVEVLDEEVFREQELTVYRRTSVFNGTSEPVVKQWGLDREDGIADFFI